MRNRWRFALFIAAALAGAPAAAQAQNDTGMKTETQERLAAANEEPSDLIWNLVGLLGLFGLGGMWRSSDNDGYTGDPI